MKKGMAVAWVIQNLAVVICFTALAIYFGKWWIVLFAVLFATSLKTQSTPVRKCGFCGRIIVLTSNNPDKEAQNAGWLRRRNNGQWEDLCPECRHKEENSGTIN